MADPEPVDPIQEPGTSPMAWSSRWRTSTIWWSVLVLASALYLTTAQRGVAWQDSAIFQYRILVGDYQGPLGLACAHPLFIVLGRIAKEVPVGDLLWRLNALTGLGMAVALANFMALLVLLTGRRWIAVLFTAVFGLSHISWWLATITETYTWVAAGLTLELYLLVRLIREPGWGKLTLLALANGLSFSLHNFALLPVPVYAIVTLALVWKKRVPIWSLGSAALAYLASAGLFIGLIVAHAGETGSLIGAVHSALFGDGGYQTVTNIRLVTEYTKANAALASLSFANAILPLAIVGWFRFRRMLGGAVAGAFGAITILQVVFIVRLATPDQFTLMLPALTMFAVAAGVGAAYLVQLSPRWRRIVVVSSLMSLLFMPLLYGFLPGILSRAGIEVSRRRMLPFRDEMGYWITPWKQDENSAQWFAEAALRQAAPDGVILSDSTPLHALRVVRHLDPAYPDVRIQVGEEPLPAYDDDPVAFRKRLGERRLYVVSPTLGLGSGFKRILEDAEFQRNQGEVLFEVRWR